MDGSSLRVSPAALALQQAITALRDALSERLAAWHDLMDVQKPWLLALYQNKLGAWDLERLNAQVAAAKAKRLLEMAQACLNRGEIPFFPAMEQALEEEFVLWQKKVHEAAEKLKDAEIWIEGGKPLSAEEQLEFKKLYRTLVKRLHPDLNPELPAGQRDLWPLVQLAHRDGDLTGLRALAAMLEDDEPAMPVQAGPLEELEKSRKALEDKIKHIDACVLEAAARPPFTLREQLADDAWIAQRRAEIESEIAAFKAQQAAFEARLQQLADGTAPGHHHGIGPN